MSLDRITHLRVTGLRTLQDVALDLNGLTVLIGDNGSGKSSLLEACEILRRASSLSFFQELHTIHGGPATLLRSGCHQLSLRVHVGSEAGPEAPLFYELVLVGVGPAFQLLRESVGALGGDVLLERTATGPTVQPQHLNLSTFPLDRLGLTLPTVEMMRVREALERIDFHLPFEVVPRWAQRALNRPSLLRDSSTIEPAKSLSLFGRNLASVYQELRNRSDWEETLTDVRLGLGEDIESVRVNVDPGGGSIALALKYRNIDEPIRAAALSEGTLAYLAFVAMYRLNDASLLTFDEPDLHLHPALLMRVLDMFESMSRRFPVLIATHSDRLLDGLTDPERSVVLCELDDTRSTRLVRPDAERLKSWLERYRGIGDLRAAGHDGSIWRKA